MPLIIITGLPTSGKTTRAKQLRDYLSERIRETTTTSTPTPSTGASPAGPAPALAPEKDEKSSAPKYRLHLISDQTLSIPRTAYDLSAAPGAHTRSANADEKDARASVYGAVKRVLSDRDIVVLDGLNYIKGWRYQLFCEAKAARTPSCVLQVGCERERARRVNEERLARRRRRREGGAAAGEGGGGGGGGVRQDGEEDGQDSRVEEAEEGAYEPDNWENLVFRYEEPNAMTRWDSPLFTLIWDDDEAQTRQVFDSIWDAVAGAARKPVKPNQATVQRSRDAGGDYLYVLDRETQDVVKRILDQQGNDGGDEVNIPRGEANDGEGEQLVVELPAGRKVGLPQLQRLRRAYMGLNRGGIGLEGVGNMGPGRIRESFVDYLNDALRRIADENLTRPSLRF
ncbi:chromatin associated protein KTI12 [Durotheca rogersii]|uniref:chromatin associated protein KTI12 n=1 Tax=Durotheca rogersii TaxID=419775 RepID=UPI002220E3E1|nr:chromatin associated protein KTI12 [Durotheca rogersii]KAI5863149.1 chromatin associated protein KTI12 [Durotheca rogersii]